VPKQAKTTDRVDKTLQEAAQSAKKHAQSRARELHAPDEESSKGTTPTWLKNLVHYNANGK